MSTETQLKSDSLKKRPDWDTYFVNLLTGVRARASCPRRRCGAIIVDRTNRVVSTGYNGPPSRLPNCTDTPCGGEKDEPGNTERCVALHAEHNAIYFAGDRQSEAYTLYCTTAPCTKCALEILQTQIKRVVYMQEYSDTYGLTLLNHAGVQVDYYMDLEGVIEL